MTLFYNFFNYFSLSFAPSFRAHLSESLESKLGISCFTRDMSEHKSIVPYPKDVSESLENKQGISRVIRDVSEHKSIILYPKEGRE